MAARRRRHLLVPLVAAGPLGVADLDGHRASPSVRPWRTPPSSVSSSCSKRMRGPRPKPEAAAGQLGLDLLDRDRAARRGGPRRSTTRAWPWRLPGGEVAQHRRQRTGPVSDRVSIVRGRRPDRPGAEHERDDRAGRQGRPEGDAGAPVPGAQGDRAAAISTPTNEPSRRAHTTRPTPDRRRGTARAGRPASRPRSPARTGSPGAARAACRRRVQRRRGPRSRSGRARRRAARRRPAGRSATAIDGSTMRSGRIRSPQVDDAEHDQHRARGTSGPARYHSRRAGARARRQTTARRTTTAGMTAGPMQAGRSPGQARWAPGGGLHRVDRRPPRPSTTGRRGRPGARACRRRRRRGAPWSRAATSQARVDAGGTTRSTDDLTGVQRGPGSHGQRAGARPCRPRWRSPRCRRRHVVGSPTRPTGPAERGGRLGPLGGAVHHDDLSRRRPRPRRPRRRGPRRRRRAP